jgi:hypothetical protein
MKIIRRILGVAAFLFVLVLVTDLVGLLLRFVLPGPDWLASVPALILGIVCGYWIHIWISGDDPE